jgi:hypothetical protein
MVRSLDEWRRGEATTLPAWIKPQLTKLVGEPPDGPEWLHEIKFDGYRIHARLDGGAVPDWGSIRLVSFGWDTLPDATGASEAGFCIHRGLS